jgi:hypothetical protein
MAVVGSYLYVGGSEYDAATGLSTPTVGRHVLATGRKDASWAPPLELGAARL